MFDFYGVLYLDSMPRFNQPLADLITRLRESYRIGLLSNSRRSTLDALLAGHNASDLFDDVMASSQSLYMKPERGIFEEMATLLDVAPGEMLFIDDSPVHTDAATSYGIPSIRFEDNDQLARALVDLGILPSQ